MRLSRRRTELALKVPTCMMQWMLPRIMRFQAEHPELQVQITTTWDHQVDFRMEPFDAAVIYAAGAGPDMHAIPLFDERLTPVCAPSLPARQPLASLDDLAGHTLLHPTRDHRDWKRWLDHAGAPHVDSTRGLSFETLDLATHAAIDGYGVAIGDRTLADESVAAHRLVMPFDISLPTGMGYYFVYPDGAEQQQKIQLFGGWIADERKGASGGAPARPETSTPPPPDTSRPVGAKLHPAAKRPLKQLGKVAGGHASCITAAPKIRFRRQACNASRDQPFTDRHGPRRAPRSPWGCLPAAASTPLPRRSRSRTSATRR